MFMDSFDESAPQGERAVMFFLFRFFFFHSAQNLPFGYFSLMLSKCITIPT